MFILQALSEVVDEWKHSLDYILEDSKWHVSDMFKAQKEALKYVSTEATGCARMNDFGLGYACHIPFKVKFSEFNDYPTILCPFLTSTFLSGRDGVHPSEFALFVKHSVSDD